MNYCTEGSTPPAFSLLACGTFSSCCGQVAAYPLALVRTKLQSQGTFVVCLSVCPFLTLSLYSLCLSFCLFLSFSLPSLSLSICLSVSLSLSFYFWVLSVCLYIVRLFLPKPVHFLDNTIAHLVLLSFLFLLFFQWLK